ncbi:MAG: VWA domain-containing protein [Deltaproteobacteria bacterium]|nr:VWA domain-containing protein [Deltaproteobacteria bacterium]
MSSSTKISWWSEHLRGVKWRGLVGFLCLSLLSVFACAVVTFFPCDSSANANSDFDPESSPKIGLKIESPAAGGEVSNSVHLAEVRGLATVDSVPPPGYDLMLALDVSGSTNDPSGTDVDGDGTLGIDPRLELVAPGTYPEGMVSTDAGDSVLAAEVLAARKLIEGLSAERVRVGLLTFSSGPVDVETGKRIGDATNDAVLEVPLTQQYDRVLEALDKIQARGGHGATNFEAGIRLGLRELAGLPGAKSQHFSERKSVLLFLTDGSPSFPMGRSDVVDPGDIEAAVRAAHLARSAGVPIHSYAIGMGALTEPVAATEIARVSLGEYVPVRNPADIVPLLQGVSFSSIEDVVLTNLSTGDFSTDVHLSPDGHFSGFVPVKEGANEVRVTALASSGKRLTTTFSFDFQLSELSDKELLLELDRIRRRNKALQLLLERKRIEDFRKREEQRKELELNPVED